MEFIFLTGFMGSGKSTTGTVLAARIGCPFLDLDRQIEKREGRSIPDIFSTDGEAGFRRIECACLRELLDRYGQEQGRLVLSLGGGTLTQPEARALIAGKGPCIYLRTRPDTVRARLGRGSADRPLLKEDTLDDLLARREHLYQAAATLTVDTDGKTPDELALLIFYSL